MITLAIDTSTPRGSVAVLSGGELLLEETFISERSHSSELFACLERVRAATHRLDQVAVGLGPGSFAGIRIAISAAIGLQLGLGLELVGIPSVNALETNQSEYLAIGDARRESYYFTHVRDGISVRGPLLLSEFELRERLLDHQRLPVFVTELIGVFPSAQIVLPSAVRLARLAAAKTGIVQRDNLEPIYLREPHITKPKTAAPLFNAKPDFDGGKPDAPR